MNCYLEMVNVASFVNKKAIILSQNSPTSPNKYPATQNIGRPPNETVESIRHPAILHKTIPHNPRQYSSTEKL